MLRHLKELVIRACLLCLLMTHLSSSTCNGYPPRIRVADQKRKGQATQKPSHLWGPPRCPLQWLICPAWIPWLGPL